MIEEPLRFKKASYSGAQSACVEVAHTLGQVRDSKTPTSPTLRADIRALITAIKQDNLA